jgi:hypothetical protein
MQLDSLVVKSTDLKCRKVVDYFRRKEGSKMRRELQLIGNI